MVRVNYVVGFLFDQDGQSVVLVEKKRPEWQRGKLNGVGGHIEANETPLEAMEREFLEEAGIALPDWKPAVRLIGKKFAVHFFLAYGILNQVSTQTDEVLHIVGTWELPPNIIPNLRWLIPLCLDTTVFKPINLVDNCLWESQHLEE